MDLSRIPTSAAQMMVGANEEQLVSDQEFVYNGSQTCPGCGRVMSPIEVMYGYGLCPACQSVKNAKLVRSMLTGPASTEGGLA